MDVLDVDTEEAYKNLTEFFLSDTFQTPIAKTPKGRHLYFKHRTGLSNAVRVVAGTDLRTLGGYVIAPPSQNGGGIPYYWLEGLKVSKVDFAEWPEDLFATLQQGSHLLYSKGGVIGGDGTSVKTEQQQRATRATTRNISFDEGGRDDAIFHLANHLVRGGMLNVDIENYLEFVASHCNPPFPPEEILIKIKSAIERSKKREINLTATLREFVSATWGNFSATDAQQAATISNTPEDRHKVRTVLGRLVDEGLIEKVRGKNGVYHRIENECQPVDWINVDCSYQDLWLPLDLGQICGVQPGNVLIFAGAKDSGKTAFMMNIGKENRQKYKVHYFNSEMGVKEFNLRAKLFDDISVNQWNNFYLYNEAHNIQDKVKPGEGNLNVIDYLEAPEKLWEIGVYIQKIHERLDGAIAVIAIQKKIGQDLGRGAEFGMEKARLYVSLDYGKAKIISCKNFKENETIKGNPRGYSTNYKLVNGCKIIRSRSGWTSTTKEEEK